MDPNRRSGKSVSTRSYTKLRYAVSSPNAANVQLISRAISTFAQLSLKAVTSDKSNGLPDNKPITGTNRNIETIWYGENILYFDESQIFPGNPFGYQFHRAKHKNNGRQYGGPDPCQNKNDQELREYPEVTVIPDCL
jgi:hypothetical protein